MLKSLKQWRVNEEAVGRHNDLLAWAVDEIDRLREIEAALPKCNRIKDGVLVCDRPVVPNMRVWRLEWPTPLGDVVSNVSRFKVRLESKGDLYAGRELADSREAAELARENTGQ